MTAAHETQYHQAKIVVAYLPFGGGHSAAASALKESILELQLNAEIAAVDLCLEVCGPTLCRILSSAYSILATKFDGALHYAIYTFSNRHPKAVTRLFNFAFGKKLDRWVAATKPSLLVCTFPLIAGIVSMRKAPLAETIIVVTDAGQINRLWLIGRPSLVIAPDDESFKYICRQLGGSSEVLMTGPIVEKALTGEQGQAKARSELGLAPGVVVYLNAGMLRARRSLQRFVQQLYESDAHVWLLVRDDLRVNDSYRRIVRKSADELHKYGIAAADVVVGKAGWSTLNEAAALNKPVLVIDRVPGQERNNESYAVKEGGARAMKPESAARLVERMAGHISSELAWSARATGLAQNGANIAAQMVLSRISEVG